MDILFWRKNATIGLLASAAFLNNALAGLFGFGGTSWKEEVLLHDGSKIIVSRNVIRGGKHEVGQEPPIKEQSLSFTLPDSKEVVRWNDPYTEDVGSANFLPMLLDMYQGKVYLVAHPMGCLAYNKWGRPNPPYVVFRYEDRSWRRIDLRELPVEIKTPNLIFSSPDTEAAKIRGTVSVEVIRALYSGYRQHEYKTILREPLMRGQINQMCMEMVPYKGTRVMPNDPVAKKFIDMRKSK